MTTMRASMWMVLAASGSRRRRRPGLMSMVSILGCSFNVVVRRHTGGTSTLSKPSGCRHGTLIWSVYGVKGLASLDPFLGAPAISMAGKRYRSCGVVSLTVLSESGSVRILTGVHCSQLVPTSGGVRVELCSQSLSSSPSTGTFGCYGYGG